MLLHLLIEGVLVLRYDETPQTSKDEDQIFMKLEHWHELIPEGEETLCVAVSADMC